MKILLALALGAMIGISAAHYQQVKKMVEKHDQDVLISPIKTIPQKRVHELAVNTRLQSSQTISSAALDKRERAFMKALTMMRKEQKQMYNQLANTNRDVEDLTFRVDSYSGQFRPLETEAKKTRAMVVPEEDDGYGNQVLPPKF